LTDRRFREALDSYITGIHDPNAPFNREEHPICEECTIKDCKEPCEKWKELIEENASAQRKQEEKQYEEWKKENPDFKED